MTQPPNSGQTRPSDGPSPAEEQPTTHPSPIPVQPPGPETRPPGPEATQLGQPGLEAVQFTQPGAEAPTLGRPLSPPTPPAYPPPPGPPVGEPTKRRGGLLVSLALAVLILFCGTGGTVAFLLLRNSESGEGAPEPVAAVDAFMTAIYSEQNPEKAASVVCAAARDKEKIKDKVLEVRNYSQKYDNPRFHWTDPRIDDQNSDRAIVSTKLTMTTADEKIADQQLRFTVVQKTGWWVCEVA